MNEYDIYKIYIFGGLIEKENELLQKNINFKNNNTLCIDDTLNINLIREKINVT